MHSQSMGRSSIITSGVGTKEQLIFSQMRAKDDLSRERRSPESFHPPRTEEIESNGEYNVEVTE